MPSRVMRKADATMKYELRLTAGGVIHTYEHEGAALAFIRDVVVFAGREAGAQFQLVRVSSRGPVTIVAQGDVLMRFALEDRIL